MSLLCTTTTAGEKKTLITAESLTLGTFQSVLHVPLKRGKVRGGRLFPVIARCARLSARCAAASESSALSSAKDDIFGERHSREAG